MFAVIVVILFALSAYVAINFWQGVQSDAWGATIIVREISEEPQSYFLLENPDPYVLEAILNPEKPVYINFFNKTQIDELVESYDTSNIEYDGQYYSIDLAYVDSIPDTLGVSVLIVVWFLFGLSALIVVVSHSRAKINQAPSKE